MMMSLSRLCQAPLGGLAYKEGTAAKLEVSPQLGDTWGNKVLTRSFPLPSLVPRCPNAASCRGSWHLRRAEAHRELGMGCRVLGGWWWAVTSSPPPAAPHGDSGFEPNLASFGEVSGPGAPPCFSVTAVRGLQGFPCSPWKKWNCLTKAFQKGKRTEPGNISSNDRSPAKSWT